MTGSASPQTKIFEIDPTSDRRWEGLLQTHPSASIFHTPGWLEALRRTYGYTPIALTSSAPGAGLAGGLPCCTVTSMWGKKRLVSLPFSDHCRPLVGNHDELVSLIQHLRNKVCGELWSSCEIRSSEVGNLELLSRESGRRFVLHTLDLRRSANILYHNLHDDCVKRKISRAQREKIRCADGRSERLVRDFYELLALTRRRHGLPPQPYQWFGNLIDSLQQMLTISVAYLGRRPVAAILTLKFKQTVTYKYGCADDAYNRFGGTQLLFWNAIRAAKEAGAVEFDMGRSDVEDDGLIAFKDRWGTSRTELTYSHYPAKLPRSAFRDRQRAVGQYVLSHTPLGILGVLGKVMYKYAG